MSITSILCLSGGEDSELNVLNSAFAVARASQAYLRILHVGTPPILYTETLGRTEYAGDGTLVNVLEREERSLALATQSHVATAAAAYGVSLIDDESQPARGRCEARLRVVIGKVADMLPAEAASVDLVIAGIEAGSSATLANALAALFHTGRPTLFVPRLFGASLAEIGRALTVVVAYDGSTSSSRALRDAIPHMQKAKDVYLIRIFQDKAPPMPPEADMIGYLAGHGVAAEWVHEPRGVRSIGEGILEKANSLEADLVVMGAYGNGHLTEMLLGGATSHVLKHSHIPLLLAH